MASQPRLATKMHSSKLPMTFVSSPPANKIKICILRIGNQKMDVRDRSEGGAKT